MRVYIDRQTSVLTGRTRYTVELYTGASTSRTHWCDNAEQALEFAMGLMSGIRLYYPNEVIDLIRRDLGERATAK